MSYVTADASTYMNQFEVIFTSTESGWIFRSFGVGAPEGATILIALTPSNMYVAISHIDGKRGLSDLKQKWVTFFDKNGIEFRLEDRSLEI